MSAQWQGEPIHATKVSIELQATLTHIPRVSPRPASNSCSAHVTKVISVRAINARVSLVLLAHAALHAKSQGCKCEASGADK